MPTGFSITLPFATTGNNPILYPDPLIGPGSLIHWDPSRQADLSFGNGSVIKNFAGYIAADIVGAAESALDSTLLVSAFPSEFATERTLKGGLHGQITAAAPAGSSRRINLPYPAGVASYILANPGHEYFMTLWAINSRLGTTSRMFWGFGNYGSYTSNYHHYLRTINAGAAGPSSGASYNPAGNPAVDVPFRASWHSSAVTGTVTYPSASIPTGWILGSPSGPGGTGNASQIIYKFDLIDLTVDGRLYADVVAHDDELFVEAFGAGGRFNGDTWSSPLA